MAGNSVGELSLNYFVLFSTSLVSSHHFCEILSVLRRSINAGRGQKSIYGQRSTQRFCIVYERKFGRRIVLATRSVIMFINQSPMCMHLYIANTHASESFVTAQLSSPFEGLLRHPNPSAEDSQNIRRCSSGLFTIPHESRCSREHRVHENSSGTSSSSRRRSRK